MTAAVHIPKVTAEATTSTFYQIRNGALNAVYWVGKQIQWFGRTIKDYAVKIYEWAKPFLEAVGKTIAHSYEKLRDFIIANKNVSLAVGLAVPVATAIALATYFIFYNEQRDNTTKTTA